MNPADAERNTDETLSLLESVKPVNAPPFFYTRLRARMESSRSNAARARTIVMARLALAALGVLTLVVLNAYSILQSTSRTRDALKEEERTSFVEEFNITNTPY